MQRGLVAAAEDNVGAELREHDRAGPPDVLATARDKRHLALEPILRRRGRALLH
jgi:hypothetical protein